MKYQIILADPPWSYKDQGCRGAMANHYRGMSLKELASLPVSAIADNNAVLFLWATYPMIREALSVIEAWGFEYKTIGFQWLKLNRRDGRPFYGLGRWTRGNTEPCLLAIRGKPKRQSRAVFQLVESPIMRHSEKPPVVRDRIVELMGDLPRIELFARKRVKGWDAIGDEIDGLDIRESIQKLLEEK